MEFDRVPPIAITASADDGFFAVSLVTACIFVLKILCAFASLRLTNR